MRILLTFVIGLGFVAADLAGLAAQATNPAYLSEMPPVARVLREIRGATPDETAARQMGTFLQFKAMIENMAGDRRYNDQLTPDEKRIIQDYYTAYWEIAKTKPEYQKFTGLKGFDIDPRWRNELFTRYFSAEFRAKHDGVNAMYDQRRAARLQADTQDMLRARAEVAEYEQKQAAKGQEQRNLARCIAAGRSETACLSEGLVKGFKDLFAGTLPTLMKTQPPGLRLSGAYTGQRGVGVTFWDLHAIVTCGDLVADERAYTVELKNDQVVLSVRTSPKTFELLQGDSKPFVLTLGANGTLTGPGPTDIKGRVIVGYREFTRHYDDGRVVPMREAIFENRTVRCDLGALPLSGPAAAIGSVSEGITAGAGLIFGGKDTTALTPAPTGLRLSGEFGSQAAFDLEFQSRAVIVGCGDAVIVREYSVGRQAGQVVVQVRHGTAPFTLTMRPDGALAGTGQVAVSGRKLAGTDANGDLAWAPAAGTCSLGVLGPAGQPGAATQTAPAPVGAPPPAAPSSSVAAPLAPGAATGTAVLAVNTGFATPAGGANPLGQRGLFLLKASFESALAANGFKPAPGGSAIKTLAAACERQAPECRQIVQALTPLSAAVLMSDAQGNGQFAAVPAGTYYVVAVTVFETRLVIWDVRVDLKSGTNSITLDQRNAAPTR